MDHTSGAAPRHTTGWPDGSNRSEEPPRLLLSPCEDLLGTMDDVYPLLVTIDYPDALTRSLRRNTDMLRSVPERTRGYLTLAPHQRRLEQRLSHLQDQADH